MMFNNKDVVIICQSFSLTFFFFKTLLEYRSQFRNPLIMVNMGEGEHSGNCWFQGKSDAKQENLKKSS